MNGIHEPTHKIKHMQDIMEAAMVHRFYLFNDFQTTEFTGLFGYLLDYNELEQRQN